MPNNFGTPLSSPRGPLNTFKGGSNPVVTGTSGSPYKGPDKELPANPFSVLPSKGNKTFVGKTIKVAAHTRKAPAPKVTVPKSVKAITPTTSLPPTNDKPPAPRQTQSTSTTQTQAPFTYTNPAGSVLFPNMTPQQLATAALAPQYAAIDKGSAADQASLKSFTQAILASLQGMPAAVGANYDQAISATQGFANQAADKLASLNPNAQDQALLQSIGAPTSQQTQVQSQLQNQFGGGAAAVLGMQGLIPAQSFEQQKAAALTYADAMPQIQAMYGTQEAKNLLYQASTQRNAVAAQYPTLYNQYATEKATNAQQLEGLKQNAQVAYNSGAQKQFDNTVTLDKLSLDQKSYALKQGVAQANLNKINPGVSAGLKYAATVTGQPILGKSGQRIPWKTAANTVKPPNGASISKLIDGWHTGKVSTVRVPAQDAQGNPVYNPTTHAQVFVSKSVQGGVVGYGQAYQRLRAMNVPDATARQYLNSAYQRGDHGRAWVSNVEQGALVKAGLPPRATIIKGRGVLSAKQTAALKRVGLLPPGGTLTKEGFYVIPKGY